MLYDIFICHASEDKDIFVRPLAEMLKEEHIEVWYDEFSLKIGDSLRRSIDKGLQQSRYGVVILSKAFFEKQWTQYELDGLLEKEISNKETIILPVWFEITHSEVAKYSLTLANKVAISSKKGLPNIVNSIKDIIHPNQSPLIIARDVLIEKGVEPPVVTDEWWINVIEFSASPYYDFERWVFSIPYNRKTNQEWGETIAWAAMQMDWIRAAEEQKITTITHPHDVLKFIDSQPGLKEIGLKSIRELGKWAPQLNIPGFGGDFEGAIQLAYEESCKEQRTDGHACSKIWCFRHPEFGYYKPSYIGYKYFRGSRVPSSPYDDADHVFWLLSKSSEWLPPKIHDFLIEGLKTWITWPWGNLAVTFSNIEKDDMWPNYGALSDNMIKARKNNKFTMNENIKTDIIERIKYSKRLIGFSETVDTIYNEFIRHGFIENNIKIESDLRDKRNE